MATITYGTAANHELTLGETLRIEVAKGNQLGDLSFIDFDQALTRDVNGIEHFGKPVLPYHAAPGMHLVDGEGQPVLRVGPVVGDGGNDIMLPGCRRELYDDGRPGCRDLIAEALGIARSQLTGMLSFFALGRAEGDYYDGLAGTSAASGISCEFTALRAITVAVSACPGTGIPGFTPGALRTHVISQVAGDTGG